MQKIATRIFIAASVIFGVFGIGFWATVTEGEESASDLNVLFGRLAGIAASVVLSSFAVSVAGKYLNNSD
ncbi:MAG: hypothetical protein O3B95_08505 [Chloroflexi bacterium]|nr:hypothetical protein [Chloroflexota bacterium]